MGRNKSFGIDKKFNDQKVNEFHKQQKVGL